MAKQQDQLKKLRLPKKAIDPKDIEETTAKVYKKADGKNTTRKTSFNLDERTWLQLKYICMSRGVSFRDLLEPALKEVVKKNRNVLPSELK